MDHLEAVIISLLVAVAFLSALATRIGIPYPILLVLGGTVLGFVPGVPEVAPRPGPRPRRLPPAAAVLGRLLRQPPRAARRRAHDHADVDRARRGRRPSRSRSPSTRSSTACRGRRASRSARSSRPTDPVAATQIRAASTCPRRLDQHPRGRGLDQRRLGARALQGRRRGDRRRPRSRSPDAGLRFVLAAAGGVAIGLVVAFDRSARSAGASTTRRSRSRSRCSAATRPTSRPTRSAPRASSPRSRPASRSAGGRPGSRRRPCASRASRSGRC